MYSIADFRLERLLEEWRETLRNCRDKINCGFWTSDKYREEVATTNRHYQKLIANLFFDGDMLM